MRHKMLITLAVALACFTGLAVAGPAAHATVQGVTGTQFTFVAREGYVQAPDGGSLYSWGYAAGETGAMQYPGPTLLLTEGDTVTITLRNALPQGAGNVSMVFPGHQATAAGGVQGLVTQEAPPDGQTAVTYTFTATHPGTYMYYSGTDTDVQVDMGLVGAIVVYPAAGQGQAYNTADSAYTYEYLFLLSEMDPVVHLAKARACNAQVDTTAWWPVYWFINGRCAPDTMAPAGAAYLPNQPYNCYPRTTPGEPMLMRYVGAGRDLHPYHFHGNNAAVIARDGRLLSSDGTNADLSYSDFTIAVAPGSTVDAIWDWTGANLGWDYYGHAPEDPLMPNEPPEVHGKPFPVTLPDARTMGLGAHWAGSPYLGVSDAIPPGQGGMDMGASYFYMWHSHNEKEMTTNNVFPGGMMTMGTVMPPGANIQ